MENPMKMDDLGSTPIFGNLWAQLGDVGPPGQRNYLWDLSGFPEEDGLVFHLVIRDTP